MTIAYPVIFTQKNDEKDTYLVYIPDMNGVTEGYGLADAIRMARDYIGCMLYDKDEDQYPKPSRLEDIDPTAGVFFDAGKSVVSAVDIDIVEYSKKLDNAPVRRNVSLPSWLNKKANEEHINVSRVLQEALMDKMNLA
ncbi:MAG: type II toxin-antitoxin system HicB family antitoxin [Lachnospiraceae bacterium]|nr:type II toxin-antitoxin system HicB family antitoxin [Lachnospiraceae bacterium]